MLDLIVYKNLNQKKSTTSDMKNVKKIYMLTFEIRNLVTDYFSFHVGNQGIYVGKTVHMSSLKC